MTDTIPVLWPPEIDVNVVSPLAIMRAQVEPLKARTKGLLRAELITTDDPDSKHVTHVLEIVAPLLQNYRRQILSVSHEQDLVYPAFIDAPNFTSSGMHQPRADSVDEFVELLGKALSSTQIVSTISSLLARINDKRASQAAPQAN